MKMVGYTPSSFADMVFAGKRIEVGLKRGKFDYPALMNGKFGENEENERNPSCDCHSYTAKFPTNPTMSLLNQ